MGPFFCLLPDITIKIFSSWWARTPIDWQLKEITDYNSISAVKERDRLAKEMARRAEALRRRAEWRKEHPLEYGQEEDDIEVIVQQELGNSPKGGAKTPIVYPAEPEEDFIGADYYGEYYNEAGGAGPDEEGGTKSAKYRKAKSKKKTKKTLTKQLDDSTVQPVIKKGATKAGGSSPLKKKQPT